MNVRFLAALAATASLLAACGGGGAGGTVPGAGSGTATLGASLVDGPFRTSGATATSVVFYLSKVEAIGSDGGVQTIATYSSPLKVDLMQYLSASSALSLGSTAIPAGTYQQLRFVLDTSGSNAPYIVLSNGQQYTLSIPSAGKAGFGAGTSTDSGDGAGTAGIKVNLNNFTAQAGQTYAFVIDFNAAESIVSAGNSGQWLMKPVLVASAQSTSGSISGTVKNNAGAVVGNAEVVAEDANGNAVNSGVTDPATGNFSINALPAGTYTLDVKNAWTSQAGASQTATGADGTTDVTVPNVTVTAGQTASVTITD